MSISLALSLLLAAAQGDPLDDARVAYSNCIADIAIENLKNESSLKDFNKAAREGCADEKLAYHNVIMSEELSMSASQSEAKKFADEEIASILTSWSDNYKDLKETNMLPVKE